MNQAIIIWVATKVTIKHEKIIESFILCTNCEIILNAINFTKENLLDTDDQTWEKKYPPFVIKQVSFRSLRLYRSSQRNEWLSLPR